MVGIEVSADIERGAARIDSEASSATTDSTEDRHCSVEGCLRANRNEKSSRRKEAFEAE